MAQVRITDWCKSQKIPRLPTAMLPGFLKKLELLASDPFYGKPLRRDLARYRSVRLGRYRIVYRYQAETDTVWIVTVGIRKAGSRQDVYRELGRLLGGS
ncbi:MAG TPA: plasmid stabilization protein [Anaerolineae bacterium]|nr:plasmid stabilization protein [Anaerolineae bacterium]